MSTDRAFDEVKIVLAVEATLTHASAAALANFYEADPRQRGAHWADLLSILEDGDYHLDVTEPMYDALEGIIPPVARCLISPVTLTLFYSTKVPPTPEDVERDVYRVYYALEAGRGVLPESGQA